jgi:hypothetical protein
LEGRIKELKGEFEENIYENSIYILYIILSSEP